MAASVGRASMIMQRNFNFFSFKTHSKIITEIPYHRNLYSQPCWYWWYSPPKCLTTGQNRHQSQTAGSPEKEAANDTEAKAEEVSPKFKELADEVEKLTENVNLLNDKYKRALADNENIRTRTRREVADAKQYCIQGFVKDLVEVADVLGKATESVPREALEEGNAHLKSLFEGLRMTEAQLLTVFKRHGVSQINPIGEKFNPNHHEALFEQIDESKEPGTVGTVTKVGYRLHERVVRPAMVGVVKKS